jgi:magnesium-transporting ATPase (P-type)
MESYRNKFPVHSFQRKDEKTGKLESHIATIPFSSFLKFNLMIRDMSANTEGTGAEQNLMIVMKGAPERIISRCSKVFTSRGV